MLVSYLNYVRLNNSAQPAKEGVGALVTVYSPAGQTVTKATLYEDLDGLIPLSNPFRASIGTVNPGQFEFCVEAGYVDIAFSEGGIDTPYTWGNVPMAITEEARGTGWFNVLDYGAVGDGVTDDRAAIQAAITACGAGQTVYFPTTNSGYLLDSVTAAGVALLVEAKRGIRLLGAGLRSCLLLGANAGLSTHALHITNSPYYTIRDLSVGTKIANQGGDAIRIGGNTTVLTKLNSLTYGNGTNRSDYGYIDNVWAMGFKSQIAVMAGQTTRINVVRIQAPSSSAGPYTGMSNAPAGSVGVYINGNNQAHGWQLTAPQIEGVGSIGVYALDTIGGKIIGGTLEGSGDGGVPLPIVSSTNASPIVVTFSGAHNMVTGQLVYIYDHLVNTNANGVHSLTVVSPTVISLDGTTGNGVGGASGYGDYLQGDIFLDGVNGIQNSVSDVYSETGVANTRNLFVNGGREYDFRNCNLQGGVLQVFAGRKHQFWNTLCDGVIFNAGVQKLSLHGQFEYASAAGRFENYLPVGELYFATGLNNGSNENQQQSGVRSSSCINYARNGGFERWVSATSLDAAYAGGWSAVGGATVVRIGDGEATTTKFAGHYSMALTSNGAGSGLQYQGPRPRFVADSALGVTVSVWARSVSGTENFAIGLRYTTSGAVNSQSFTATTTWQKFSATFPFREDSSTDYSPELLIGDAATTMYFDNFFLTDGWATQFGDWENVKLQEVEPTGRGNLTFSVTQTIYGDAATYQTVTLTGNTVLTFANWIPGVPVTLQFTQDGGGGRTVTFPAVNWAGAAAPVVTATAGRSSLIVLVYDGTSYWEISRNLNVF